MIPSLEDFNQNSPVLNWKTYQESICLLRMMIFRSHLFHWRN